jgi:hypothetical protein
MQNLFLEFLLKENRAVSDLVEGWCAVGDLGASNM